MPDDFPIKDPQTIWQGQPTEPFKMSAYALRLKMHERQSRGRLEASVSVVVGLVCCAFFLWTFTKAHSELARMGWLLLSLWGIYAAYYACRWMWPQDVPENAPITTCLAFYRKELEKRRDDLRHRWWRSGLPFLLLGMAMVIAGTGGQTAPTNPLINAIPLLLVLAVWVVAFFAMKKKLGREDIQKKIEELRAFETDTL